MSFHSISARLAAFTVFAGLLLVTIAAVGLLGGKKAVDALNSVYEDRTVPLVDLFRLAELRAANEKEILLRDVEIFQRGTKDKWEQPG